MNEWKNERMNERANEWMDEWMNEWMNEEELWIEIGLGVWTGKSSKPFI